ncbi:hypothetical protein WJX84_002207 [Apatococcus fuscideae]|uniref:Uncharacterized protein n=1 Tax=Apatococcus fuscideae TaxID=2026836 RepID=A0AAW1RX69_9CHLO
MTEVKLPRTHERHLKLSESSEREKKKKFKAVKPPRAPPRPAAAPQQKNPFQQLGDALLSPLPPDVRADFGATFSNIGATINGARESIWRAMTGNRS